MIGQQIGPYAVLSKLGEGGMGEVYRARDTRLERDVALKVLPAETIADETARARLIREARLASKLNHPHICTIYGFEEAPLSDSESRIPNPESRLRQFIVMELVEGQPLSARLDRGAVPVDEAVGYGRQMAAALAHAHARGVVHRDFKSANVVVTTDGQVKVLDFGLAKRLAADEGADAATRSRQSLTEVGVTPGTLAYMAPEQLKGQPADARSDIWALGVVLYELVSGQRPFQGKTGFELSSAILSQPIPPVPASVPTPFAHVIEHCLAKEPGERYQQADVVKAALDAVAAGRAPALPSAARGARKASRRLAAGLAVTLALAVIALMSVAFDLSGLGSRLTGNAPGAATPDAGRVIRLAVLPFANLSGNPDQDYLSDGLTTEMIALLGGLHPEGLRVIARTTAMSYKKTDKPIDQIGRELGVDYVLEGSAQREAGRIRITADLIKVADQTQLWADRYERELAGILVLQNDVARQVANALALKLLPAEQARLAGARIVDPEVYNLCLKGNDHLARVTAADFDTAEQYFRRALAKDPASAAAYAGMAGVWLYRRQMRMAPAREAGEKARAAALKAVALDDSLAAAHLRLAGLLSWTDFNFTEAEREYKRTLELDPNDATARALYSHVLIFLGRPDEAMQQIERAVASDPLDAGVRGFYADALLYARRYDEAIAQANAVLRAQPAHLEARGALFYAQHMKGQHADVIASAVAGDESTGYADVAEALRKGYAESGYAGAWRQANAVLLAKHDSDPGVAMIAARRYAMAGEPARALPLLERAYEERNPSMPYIGCMPIFDPLRGEPRFQALLRKMNLPQ